MDEMILEPTRRALKKDIRVRCRFATDPLGNTAETEASLSAPFLLQVMAALGAKSIDLDEALTDLATTN